MSPCMGPLGQRSCTVPRTTNTGFGNQQSEESNLMARMATLAEQHISLNLFFFSIENPLDSFIWYLSVHDLQHEKETGVLTRACLTTGSRIGWNGWQARLLGKLQCRAFRHRLPAPPRRPPSRGQSAEETATVAGRKRQSVRRTSKPGQNVFSPQDSERPPRCVRSSLIGSFSRAERRTCHPKPFMGS